MVAHVALDPSVESGKFAFAGDRISILDAAKVIEQQVGRPLERRSNGSEEQLRAAQGEAARNNPQMAVMLAYQLYMLNGQTALTNLQNDRYSDVRLESFHDFAARALPHETSSMHR